MDLRQLVQKKLTTEEKCLQCIEAAQIVDDKRLLRVVAIAEKNDTHAFSCIDEYYKAQCTDGKTYLCQVKATDDMLGLVHVSVMKQDG